jgi:hypothetical protein
MAFPGNQGALSDIIATTIEKRSKKIADNVTKNNALLAKMQTRGRSRSFSGGRLIYEELSFAENGNAGFYSGYDLLPVAAQDVISAAQFDIKQAACPVTISGLEQLQNAGPEEMISLITSRLDVAESTMMNLVCGGMYSDGTGFGGKQIVGLNAAVPFDPTTGVYGGIDRSVWTFWQSKLQNSANTTTLQADMNLLWSNLVRGMDRPDLIVMDGVVWRAYMASLQANQRFTDSSSASLGFPTVKFMDCDVVLDGGIGGFCQAGTAYFLNTKYIHYRPHSARNFVSLSPNKRYSINQDAEVQILGWAGALTCSGAQFQGRLDVN